MDIKICADPTCNKPFEVNELYHWKRFCSRRCQSREKRRRELDRKRKQAFCQTCLKPIEAVIVNGIRYNRRNTYCCKTCASRDRVWKRAGTPRRGTKITWEVSPGLWITGVVWRRKKGRIAEVKANGSTFTVKLDYKKIKYERTKATVH